MRITTGLSRHDTNWKLENMTWDELCDRLSKPKRTSETSKEYAQMTQDEKSKSKDVGGFVGAVFSGNRRLRSAVQKRTLITLDADYAETDSWKVATQFLECTMCCYSTHSHTESKPRLRYVIPLAREVEPDEYEPIARWAAIMIGIEQMDISTYETSRLFYWPSASQDAPFFFDRQDGFLLDPDEVLSQYADWRDTTSWYTSSKETEVVLHNAKAQQDPESKSGVIGLFCRAYDVPSAIDKFLQDVYTSDDGASDRYTYCGGSTANGLVIYEGGKFAYSHHATDPAFGKLCNAFDLVRIHLFGSLDKDKEEAKEDKLPSYKEMLKFAQNDDAVKIASATEAFSNHTTTDDDTPPDMDWAANLEYDSHNAIKATTNNLVLILENDPNLAHRFAVNEFKNRPCIIRDTLWHKVDDKKNGDPWRDEDRDALTHYVETTYGIYNTGKLSAAFSVVANKQSYHPVRDYLRSLVWDGTERVENLFIEYLGAADTKYTKVVTKKWMTAAVARVMVPGIKFDNLVVMVGHQASGKSYLGSRLGGAWFSDTFGTVQGKEAYEQLKGSWIIEISELSAMKKAEVEAVKMFISKREDNYRGAYREFAEVNKRQCVFYGTTNDSMFLRDQTGNRRFWPIGTNREGASEDVFDISDEYIDQLWAEAVHLFDKGEKLYLTAEEDALAQEEQAKYMLYDPRQGMVEEYLDKLLPDNWDELTKQARRDYIQGYTTADNLVGVNERNEVSIPELAYELFGDEVLEPWKAKDLHNIMTVIEGWHKTGIRKYSVYGRQTIYIRDKQHTGG